MRNRTRTSTRTLLTEALLQQARSLMEDGSSIRQAAKAIGFSEAALRKRMKKGKGSTTLGRFTRTFSAEQEEAIVQHCIALDIRFFGLTLRSLRSLIFQYAVKNNIEHRFVPDSKLAGRDFTREFMKRNHLSLRTPRKTSIARMMGFNKKQLDTYFDNLEAIMVKYGFTADRLYNMDETGVQTVPNKLPKHVAPTGKRDVGKSVSAEQGQTVTVVCSMSAVGHHVPPFFIFARKRLNPLLIKGGPAGCDMAVTDKGYMTTPTFITWFSHFLKFTNPTAERPILLILDNHVSHVSLESITFDKANNIHMLSLPPHSSHKTQPLDRNFFRPFKTYYDTAADSWNVSRPGQTLSLYNVAEIVKTAFDRAATVENAVEGFRATGIFPFNRHKFSDADFAPSEVTDQDYDQDNENVDIDEQRFIFFGDGGQPNDEVVGIEQENVQSVQGNEEQEVQGDEEQEVIGNKPEDYISGTSNSTNRSVLLSPGDIMPLPKIQVRRKRRKGLKSELLTSTPHKIQLETMSAEKQRLEEEKKKRALERSKRKLSFPSKSKPSLKRTKGRSSSSSSESETNMSLHNSSSDYENFCEDYSDTEEDGSSEMQKGDFAIVKVQGKTKTSFRLYVFKTTSSYSHGYDGIFYKRIPQTTRFQETEEDGYVDKNDIILHLTKPIKKSSGRFHDSISFSEDLSDLTIY